MIEIFSASYLLSLLLFHNLMLSQPLWINWIAIQQLLLELLLYINKHVSCRIRNSFSVENFKLTSIELYDINLSPKIVIKDLYLRGSTNFLVIKSVPTVRNFNVGIVMPGFRFDPLVN